MKLKDTLNLPRSEFPMRARLPEREPETLERWESEELHALQVAARAGRPTYLLHDGPPYANGHLHMGHALNKVLKDIVVRYKILRGFSSPYVPGWDCHGMPIEHQVTRDLGEAARTTDVLEIRRLCREYAQKWVGIQSEEFRRLGSIGYYGDPYVTMDYAYEAEILRAFRDLVEGGYVIKGLRSIHWCATCQTALAEAELEYAEHRSPSIYVAFPLEASSVEGSALTDILEAGGSSSIPELLIWTTTPWTIPANLAIAVHPELDYLVVRAELDAVASAGDGEDPAADDRAGEAVEHRLLIVAKGLSEHVRQEIGATDWDVLGRVSGRALEGLQYRHPLYDRTSPVILAEHVTLEHGTGAVHTAPGHGHEDFEVGRQYGLDVLCPVDEAGIFDADAGPFEGMQVFDANGPIVEALAVAGALLHSVPVDHSYPHCWRCKSPLIYRATEQWFLAIDAEGLRGQLLSAIRDDVEWVPAWGEDRIAGMVEGRPDWCLSRQRAWGVPIPALYCTDCGELRLDVGVIDRAADVVQLEGSDAWFRRPAEDFVAEGTACDGCGGTSFRVEHDIFDVWFESGVSHRAVLESGRWPQLKWPAELYLEGHDQHRGWFQVSLITSGATRGRPPYDVVLTHGHVLDGEGRKMSKSLGNISRPMDIVEEYGADILRLYLASVDYTRDLAFSTALIEPVAETYRKMRNTLRYLLANLFDFDPAAEHDDAHLQPIDRWVLDQLVLLDDRLREDFDGFRFHRGMAALHNFASVTLSAVYLDVIKDRLYTSAADAEGRRAAQRTCWILADALTRWLAPVLCFTADEVWSHLPGEREANVHLAELPDLEQWRLDDDARAELAALMQVRDEVLGVLEEAREADGIGSGLEAAVWMRPSDGTAELLRRNTDWLADLFIVSEAHVLGADDAFPDGPLAGPRTFDGGSELAVTVAPGGKCDRCWAHRQLTPRIAEFPNLCERCADVVEAAIADAD